MYTKRSMRNRNNAIRLFEALEGLEFIVFDTETTGLKPTEDYIVQLSAIKYKVNNHRMEEIDTLDLFMKPPFLMDQKVIGIHGITNEFLADKNTEKEEFGTIKNFFGKSILVGYNIEFDIRMLDALYYRNKESLPFIVKLDVLEMARDLVPPTETSDHKLGTMAKLYQVDDGLTFHRAIEDVKATARLLYVFYLEYKKVETPNLSSLWVNYIYFWNGFNKNQRGVYVDTNMGKIYFSTTNKCWCSTNVNLDMYDIQKLEKNILDRTGLSFDEFSKLTEKRFEELKAAGRV